MQPQNFETGSGGFVWKNILPDRLLSQVKFHVYTAHEMHIGKTWAGDEFVNHYNRIYYVESGEAVLQFADRTITMRPGHLYLIPAYQLISHHAKGELHFLWMHFQASFEADLDLFMLYGHAEEIDCRAEPTIRQDFLALIESVKDTRPTMLLKRNMLLLRLLLPFMEKFSDSADNLVSFRHQSLLPALNMINSHLATGIEISKLAEATNMSPEHFSRKFKAAFNIAPKRYVLAKRIEMAKQLLLLDNSSIGQVSERCGFCDLYHFSRTFKQETGASPSEFRNQYAIPK